MGGDCHLLLSHYSSVQHHPKSAIVSKCGVLHSGSGQTRVYCRSTWVRTPIQQMILHDKNLDRVTAVLVPSGKNSDSWERTNLQVSCTHPRNPDFVTPRFCNDRVVFLCGGTVAPFLPIVGKKIKPKSAGLWQSSSHDLQKISYVRNEPIALTNAARKTINIFNTVETHFYILTFLRVTGSQTPI